jgi:hypothetical protein
LGRELTWVGRRADFPNSLWRTPRPSGENVFANALCGGGSGGRAGDGDEGINGHSIDNTKQPQCGVLEKCMCVWKHSAGTNAYDGQVPEQQMDVAPGEDDVGGGVTVALHGGAAGGGWEGGAP